MMNYEKKYNKFKELKRLSGNHSPSINQIEEFFPEIKIDVDGCYLSNPYATKLFENHLRKHLEKNLSSILGKYPSQNKELSHRVGNSIGINPDNLFIGNGASEIIQAILKKFSKKVISILPTFSAYYENNENNTIFYTLDKKNNFKLDIKDLINFTKTSDADTLVLINPNNPDGGFIEKKDLLLILAELKSLNNIIIDESFIDFTAEDPKKFSIMNEYKNYDNLIIIRSLAKDFGLPGIRVGFSVMSQNKVNQLYDQGFLWNINGFAEFFYKIYSNSEFKKKYSDLRKKYYHELKDFKHKLLKLPNIRVYNSKANFFLIELLDKSDSDEFTFRMLYKHGIYLRSCSDKKGLSNHFIRVAVRSKEENKKMIEALKKELL